MLQSSMKIYQLIFLSKMFVCILSYFKIDKVAHKNNPRTHSPQQNKKGCVSDSCLFQSLYSRKLVDTIVKLKNLFE